MTALRATWALMLCAAFAACGQDDTDANAPTTTSGAGGDTSTGGTTGSGGSTASGGAGGTTATGGSTGTAGGGGASGGAGGAAPTCTAFGATCVPGVTVCCDAAGETGECFVFGQGPRCTILCPPNPADCPNNGAGCNNQVPPRCKTS